MAKTIVITGAGGGLGRALARRFAADGETVILMGRTLATLQEVAADCGERAMCVACDVTSPDSVREAFAKIAERHPKIDVLINNAAIFELSLVADATDQHILRSIGTNLTGPILCVRAAIPMLPSGGHIINVTSESVELPFPYLSLYQSTKAGLERFTISMHRELEPLGIRSTYIRAGQMMGEGSKAFEADPAVIAAFFEAAAKAGLHLMERPITDFPSVTGIFRSVIDLPPNLHAVSVALHSRVPGG